jgi:hypothetical protein
MKIFIGNLPFAATEEDIKKLFAEFGSVLTVDIVKDSDGDSRGFGFVEMTADAEGHAAITGLNERDFQGRAINVSPALIKPGITRRGEGRRSRNYLKRMDQGNSEQGAGARPRHFTRGASSAKPWQQRPEQRSSGFWEKRQGRVSVKPWEKRPEQGASRTSGKPWEKRSGPGNPWEKRSEQGAARPWEKRSGPGKPWEQRAEQGSGRPSGKPWETRPQYGTSRPSGKPWERRPDRGPSKPWEKRTEQSTSRSAGKPWEKKSGTGASWGKRSAQTVSRPAGKSWHKGSEKPRRPGKPRYSR